MKIINKKGQYVLINSDYFPVYRSYDKNDIYNIGLDIIKNEKSYKPTGGMKIAANRALEWKKEGKSGGTAVGFARARDIVNGKNLSASTVKRMFSFFSRHEVNKKAKGFNKGEEGYPSNGRVAWDLWGGDSGFSWSRKIANQLRKDNTINILRAISFSDVLDEIQYLLSDLESPVIYDYVFDENENYFVISNEGCFYKLYYENDNIRLEKLNTNSVMRSKDKNKKYFYGIFCSAALNRSGEFDTVSLLKSLAASYYNQKNVNLYHNNKLVVGKTIDLFFYDKYLIGSGYIDISTKLGEVTSRAINNEEWGFSIEYWLTKLEFEKINGVKVQKNKKGYFDGLAILKNKEAASLFTQIRG